MLPTNSTFSSSPFLQKTTSSRILFCKLLICGQCEQSKFKRFNIHLDQGVPLSKHILFRHFPENILELSYRDYERDWIALDSEEDFIALQELLQYGKIREDLFFKVTVLDVAEYLQAFNTLRSSVGSTTLVTSLLQTSITSSTTLPAALQPFIDSSADVTVTSRSSALPPAELAQPPNEASVTSAPATSDVPIFYFLDDVTYADGAEVPLKQSITKTWKVQYMGKRVCPLARVYYGSSIENQLTSANGFSFDIVTKQFLHVQPGQILYVQVELEFQECGHFEERFNIEQLPLWIEVNVTG